MRRVLEIGQRFGVNITPVHFYSDIPNFRVLRASEKWKRPYTFQAVAGTDLDSQLAFVQDACAPYTDRLAQKDIHTSACEHNGAAGFGCGEAAFLYAFARRHKPQRIIQIGCGVSTAVLLMAADDEPGYTPEIICIEPYPTDYLLELSKQGRITLIQEFAQDVSIERLTDLSEGDLFFVDSTHTLNPGSEVSCAILEVLPRLRAGTWVHFHDIQFPYNYGPNLMSTDIFFCREELMLHAFLACNTRYELAASLSWLHNERCDELTSALVDYSPCAADRGLKTSDGDFAVSAYLRVIA
ncbi:class I SAM-dependent methyltransferase [Planctomycetaceae bacterium AH-315-I19]|nr:class I SAM-dependent methyltransferase [Planctomycetaceae bacterium AH-315-I19]MBN4060301.1 class I SAM-dependent methyltransferase [Planctomycetaceae bacterium AH-315-I19]